MRVELQPLGPERMMQKLQDFIAQTSAAPGFQMPGGPTGLAGNLPGGNVNGYAPFDPKGLGVGLSNDAAPPEMRSLIERAANENGVDPALLDAVVAVESSYNPNTRSRAGAMGLTQLMPDNVKELGITNPFDPEQNLQGGAKYLSQMLARYPGRIDYALAAYNAGPGKVDQFKGIPPYTETKNYVNKVLGLYNIRKGQP